MTAKPRPGLLVNLALATVLVLPILYVLSYAPVLRWRIGSDPRAIDQPRPDGLAHLPGYGPVEWIHDRTPLTRPLLWWAEVWGCEDAVFWSSAHRNPLAPFTQAPGGASFFGG